MNIPASLGDHFAKLKSQLMYREMQENLFIPRQRQVMPNDLFAALMPSHNASAAANQAMQLHMLLQQYFVKSALFNHHQQAALKSIFPPQVNFLFVQVNFLQSCDNKVTDIIAR